MTALRTMTSAEYAAWLQVSIPAYAADKVASGQWTEEESLERSRKENDELLPQGLNTADNYLYTVIDDQEKEVGMLWFAVKTKFGSKIAYVFDVAVLRDRQREGHAFGAFQALEQVVVSLGLSGIALHVFGHNTGAQALYAKLGFSPTNISLFKAVNASA